MPAQARLVELNFLGSSSIEGVRFEICQLDPVMTYAAANDSIVYRNHLKKMQFK
jgi:hypothetical protein